MLTCFQNVEHFKIVEIKFWKWTQIAQLTIYKKVISYGIPVITRI